MNAKITFYDVEHGSCCHIITPNGMHILVDVGSKTDSSIVQHICYKYFRGKKDKIDALIITHPHEDHIYDLPALTTYLPPRVLWRPKGAFDIIPSKNTPEHVAIAATANQINRSYNQSVDARTDPTDSQVNGGVTFKIIMPKDEWTDKSDLNTFSSIIVITCYGYKFVLTGDNPASILREMIKSNYNGIKEAVGNATVLLAPHHGRAGEFCQEFFDCVNPMLTVVSDKPIVHSTQEETSSLYKGRGVELYGVQRYVLTTRNDGTVSFDVGVGHCYVGMSKEVY